MKKEVCVVLLGIGLVACGRGTESPQTPEMRTQQPTEAWSMPEVEDGTDDPAVGPGTSAPGSYDREREVPSTRGTGDDVFIVPNDPAGGSGSDVDVMGSPDSSGVQRPDNTNVGPGIPGDDTTSSPGVPGGSNTTPGTNPPGGAVKPGQNPGVAPGGTPPSMVPGAGTDPGGR